MLYGCLLEQCFLSLYPVSRKIANVCKWTKQRGLGAIGLGPFLALSLPTAKRAKDLLVKVWSQTESNSSTLCLLEMQNFRPDTGPTGPESAF